MATDLVLAAPAKFFLRLCVTGDLLERPLGL